MTMTKTEARKQIGQHVQNAYDEIRKAEELADQYDIGFEFSVSYGMGGYYTPRKDTSKTLTYDEALKLVESGEHLTPDQRTAVVEVLKTKETKVVSDWSSSYDSDYDGWHSSSSMC